jgi:hypothetical protein
MHSNKQTFKTCPEKSDTCRLGNTIRSLKVTEIACR